MICDLVLSDPCDEETRNWEQNKMRACSYFYSPLQTMQFLSLNKIKMIIRGHEVQMRGYRYQEIKEHQKRRNITLTVFSAPNYCDTYKNEGAILQVTVLVCLRRNRALMWSSSNGLSIHLSWRITWMWSNGRCRSWWIVLTVCSSRSWRTVRTEEPLFCKKRIGMRKYLRCKKWISSTLCSRSKQNRMRRISFLMEVRMRKVKLWKNCR